MPNLIFRGAFIRSVHISNPDTGQRKVSGQLTADFSDQIIEKMKWGQVAESGEFTPMGREKGQMKVGYTKQLLLGETEEVEDEDQQSFDDGEDEPVEVGAGTLASAREMGTKRPKAN